MNLTTRVVIAGVLLIVCTGGGYLLGMEDFFATKGLIKQLEQLSGKQAAHLDTMAKQLQLKQIELQTELAKSAVLLSDLQAQTLKNAEIEAKLSLFRKVMSPEKSVGGLEINSVLLQPLAQKNRFRLNVVMLQLGRTKPLVSGKLEIALSGLQEGMTTEVKHRQLLEGQAKQLKFRFRYLAEIETVLVLPEGFAPEAVSLKLNFSRSGHKGSKRLEQSFDWLAAQKSPQYLN